MAAITQAILTERTGRENGPDFLLKVEIPQIPANSVITPTSNITEVLNVIAYLCNSSVGSRTDLGSMLPPENSVDSVNSGAHVPGTGQYLVPNLGTGASANTLWVDDLNAVTTPMVSLITFQTPNAGYSANHIPVGILARQIQPVQAFPNAGLTSASANLAIVLAPAVVAAIPADVSIHFSGAVIQMIHILEKTRDIFGPKGWTALFSQVKGGGAKRTRRQHRRKYSSKQY